MALTPPLRLTTDGPEKRSGERSVDETGKVSRSYTESFTVEANLPLLLPQVYDLLNISPAMVYPGDPYCRLRKVKADQLMHHGSVWRWVITADYSNLVPDESEIEDDNPFNTPAKVRREEGEMEIALTKDVDGNAILLPNKRPFNPPVTVMVPTIRLVISRNERQPDMDPEGKYRKRVNESSWAGKEPEEWLCKSISSEEDWRNGIKFYPTEYVFEWNPLGWNEDVLAADTYELVDGKARPILDADKQPITDPVPIDSDGIQIEAESLPAEAYYQKIKKYLKADFSGLSLPV